MIERIYERSRGMAKISRRVFSRVREPGLPAAWTAAACDPFVLLENGIGGIVDSAVPAGAVTQTGTGAERRRNSAIGRQTFDDTIASRSIAGTTAVKQEQANAQRAPFHAVPQFSGPRMPSLPSPVFPEYRNSFAANEPFSATPIRKPSATFIAYEKTAAATPPQFTYAETAQSENEAQQARADRVQRRESELLQVPANGPTTTSASLPVPQHELPGSSRLVQNSGLIHLLRNNTVAAKMPQNSSLAAPVVNHEEAAPAPTLHKKEEAPAPTVETLLDELEDRLRFEYLRTYGSSGE